MVTISVFLLSFMVVCITAGPQTSTTNKLQTIVENVRRDVDIHLKKNNFNEKTTKSVSTPTATEFADSVEYNTGNLMKILIDSVYHYLMRSPAIDNRESVTYSKSPTHVPIVESPTRFQTPSKESSPKSSTGISDEASSQVPDIHVGSVKGEPGVDFPNYEDIPITSFKCWDKTIPGFYADLETGCQVFHVCWKDRRESFLCPIGTTFNQAIQLCDYWYNSNCSFALYYYNTENLPSSRSKYTLFAKVISDSIQEADSSQNGHSVGTTLAPLVQFMPVKAKVVTHPQTENLHSKTTITSTIGARKKSSLDLKSRLKQRISSHSKLPTLAEFVVKSPTDDQTDNLKWKINRNRLSEALDLAVNETKNDVTASKLLPYVEKVAQFIKWALDIQEPVEPIQLKPGSQLYEHDTEMKSTFKKINEVGKKILLFIGDWINVAEKRMHKVEKVSQEVKLSTSNSAPPLTKLNPRFIVKPASYPTDKLQLKDESFVKPRRVNASHPSKLSQDRISIYPATKKTLLKNYVKLFNVKRTSPSDPIS